MRRGEAVGDFGDGCGDGIEDAGGGRAAFAAIRERETAFLSRVAAALPSGAAETGRVALMAFREELARVAGEG